MERGLVLLVAALGMLGCVSQNSHTVLMPGEQAKQLTGAADAPEFISDCPAAVWVDDESVKARPLNDLEDQAIQAMAQSVLEGSGPEIVLGSATGELQVTVKRAYVHPLATSKSAVVVITVTEGDGGKPAFLRGQSVGVNWWGTTSEFRAAISRALEQALSPLRNRLLEVCERTAQSRAS